MAFNNQCGPSSASFRQPSYDYPNTTRAQDPSPAPRDFQLDPLEWYPHFQTCRRFFLDHAQHNPSIHAVAAFMNILLPFQRHPHPIPSSGGAPPAASSRGTQPPPARASQSPFPSGPGDAPGASVSLTPYIRRLVVTGLDTAAVLATFFGGDWAAGVGALHAAERRNYLFAAKSAAWLDVKASYEPDPAEAIPCMTPLRAPAEAEIRDAEDRWSDWLAMQDWMVGPRAPAQEVLRAHVKREPM